MIEGFAMFIMGGSVFLGLVVFGVLLIVNFIVITKGAGRMAEVGARFALDGMPGKQLAIDSDMAAGAISHAEARERRRIEQEETTFFGSLDGASKFVKGDAVAGLLITLLNLVMGLAMGVLVHDMPVRDAFETYSILTVGDGLVTQIPAVIISIASAMLLSKGGLVGSTDRALIRQLGGYPTALGTVAVLMALFAFIPGLPFVPFLIGAGCLAAAAWLAGQTKAREAAAEAEPEVRTPAKRSLGDLLDIDEIHMEFAPNLVPVVMDEATGLDARIVNMRNHIAGEFGLILPEIRLTDNPGLPNGTYAIRIQGVEAARSAIETDKVLVLLPDENAPAPEGRSVAEPVYGAPARWIAPALPGGGGADGPVGRHPDRGGGDASARDRQGEFRAAVHPAEPAQAPRRVHLAQRSQAGRGEPQDARRVRAREGHDRHAAGGAPAAARGAGLDPQPAVDPRGDRRGAHAAGSPRGALRARAAPDRLPARRRAAGGGRRAAADPAQSRPGRRCSRPTSCPRASGIVDVALPPAEFNRLAGSIAERIAHAGAQGRYPAVVTSTKRRRFLHTVLAAKGIRNPVLSFEEIGTGARPAGARARLMFEGLAAFLDLTEAGLVGLVLVFARVAAVVSLLPGFGEQIIPARVRLGVAVAFTLVVWPMLAPDLLTTDPARPFLAMLAIEVVDRAAARALDPADGDRAAARRLDRRAVDGARADLRRRRRRPTRCRRSATS